MYIVFGKFCLLCLQPNIDKFIRYISCFLIPYFYITVCVCHELLKYNTNNTIMKINYTFSFCHAKHLVAWPHALR